MNPRSLTTREIPSVVRRLVAPATLLAFAASLASTQAADTTNAPAKPAPQLTPEQMFEGGKDSYANWVELLRRRFHHQRKQ